MVKKKQAVLFCTHSAETASGRTPHPKKSGVRWLLRTSFFSTRKSFLPLRRCYNPRFFASCHKASIFGSFSLHNSKPAFFISVSIYRKRRSNFAFA